MHRFLAAGAVPVRSEAVEASVIPVIPAIIGPTASGKSALARELADRTGGRIISVDSRKIYRRLNIGTAKPSPELIARYDYAMIDLIEPSERYSAYQYAQAATTAIQETLASGRLPILAGGTGLYLRALKDGLFDGPEADEKVRDALRREAAEIGWQRLHDRLREIDPDAADKISPDNLPRLERALEVYLLTGEPISILQKTGHCSRPPWQFMLFGVERAREELSGRTEARVELMVQLGLFEEVEALLATGADPSWPGFRTVGYAEVIACLAGKIPRPEAIEKIKTSTRQYAKRQLTWFRHQEVVRWVSQSPDMVDIVLSHLS